MRAALAMVALLGALPEQPSGEQAAWSQPNGDATYVASQAPSGTGCHLRVVHDADQVVLWESDACFAAKSDRAFLSRDGTRLIVVATFPPAAGKQAAGWRESPVVWLYEKGQLLASATAGQLVKDGSQVRREVSHFTWLQGVNGVPGVPPRLGEQGDGVELDAIDGTHAVLAFSGFKLPPLKAQKSGSNKKKHHR